MLHLPLAAARVILQLPARPLERVVDGEIQIRAPFVVRRGVLDIDLAAVGKREPNVDVIKTAGVMPLARTFHHHPASRHPAPALLEPVDMLLDSISYGLGRAQILELDLGRCLHLILQNIARRSRGFDLAKLNG